MTYRGVYRGGVVRLEGEVDLPEGSVVEVSRAGRTSRKRTASEQRRANAEGKAAAAYWKRLTSKRMTKAQRLAAFEAAFGAWKDRPEWEGLSSAQIAAELRKRAARRGRNG